jgi:hypothetical protein
VLTTTAQPVINMGILDNLEASMADDDGMPNKTVTETIQEMTEDPEYNKLMERLKYMEDNGI